MEGKRSILIVGGGTAGWLTAAYLAKFLDVANRPDLSITLVESPDIGIVGVGEGAFPTIRTTLQFLDIDERNFIRATGATFKQGIRFDDWARTPISGKREHYFHPFEAPLYAPDASLVALWLAEDEATRPPFAEAVTIQHRVAEERRGPKRARRTDSPRRSITLIISTRRRWRVCSPIARGNSAWRMSRIACSARRWTIGV